VLNFQPAEARFSVLIREALPRVAPHFSSSIDWDFLPSDRIDPDLATEKEVVGAPEMLMGKAQTPAFSSKNRLFSGMNAT
jgi:hypothetical protein